MIINSKFVDYYDCIHRTVGVDKSVVYDRNSSKLKDNLPKKLPSYHQSNSGGFITLEYVIFCGKLYPYLETYSFGRGYSFDYDLATIKDTIKGKLKWFNPVNDLEAALVFNWTHYCLKHKVPVIKLIRENNANIELNPNLRNIEFFKVMNTFQCYQTIYQFLGMLLTKPEKEPREISDKLKAQNHGFNKWSFRRDVPPSRKQK